MSDSTLYLYTSLTAGSSHIVTATARLETILKANKLPFRAIDVATDDTARKLWGRRSKGKKLPGLVKYGTIVGDLEEIEEWNEYGELRMVVSKVEDFDSIPATDTPAANAAAAAAGTASTPSAESAAPKQSTIKIQSPPPKETPKDASVSAAMKQAGEEAASKAKGNHQEKESGAAGEPTSTTSEPKPSDPITDPGDAAAAAAAAAETTEKTHAEKETEPEAAAKEGSAKAEDNSVRRKSVAADVFAAENENSTKKTRPPLTIPEEAAVSSANIRADYAEALGLVEHHRGSIISATSKEEHDTVARDLRQSISGYRQDMLDQLKEEKGKVGTDTVEETIDEEESEDDVEGPGVEMAIGGNHTHASEQNAKDAAKTSEVVGN